MLPYTGLQPDYGKTLVEVLKYLDTLGCDQQAPRERDYLGWGPSK